MLTNVLIILFIISIYCSIFESVFSRQLGHGAFGEVYKGYLSGMSGTEREVTVAVKVRKYYNFCLIEEEWSYRDFQKK